MWANSSSCVTLLKLRFFLVVFVTLFVCDGSRNSLNIKSSTITLYKSFQ